MFRHSGEIQDFRNPPPVTDTKTPLNNQVRTAERYRGLNHHPVSSFFPMKMPSAPSELISARLVGYLPLMNGFASWLQLLPRYLGRAVCVDEACNALNNLMEYRCCWSKTTTYPGRAARSYQKAIELVKPEMQTECINDTVLLCVSLLAMLEQLARAWHDTYESQVHDAFVHWRGIGASFLALEPHAKRSEITRALWDACWEPVVVVPVAQGLPSPFEEEMWLSPQPHVSHECQSWAMRRAINRLKIQLPRMVLHVQQLWDEPANVDFVNAALDLACSLLAIIATKPEKPLINTASMKPATDEMLRRLGIWQYDLTSNADLECFTLYYKVLAWLNALFLNMAKCQQAMRARISMEMLNGLADDIMCKLLAALEMAESTGPFSMVRLVQGLILGREALLTRTSWRGVPMREFDEWLHPKLRLELNISAAYDEDDLRAIVQLKLGKPDVDCVISRVARGFSKVQVA